MRVRYQNKNIEEKNEEYKEVDVEIDLIDDIEIK
jgi:hypothetical protein